jgi:hypothetical protein
VQKSVQHAGSAHGNADISAMLAAPGSSATRAYPHTPAPPACGFFRPRKPRHDGHRHFPNNLVDSGGENQQLKSSRSID